MAKFGSSSTALLKNATDSASQPGNGTRDQRFNSFTLANLARELVREPLIGRSPHELQRLSNAFFRSDVKKRRLLQLYGQRLLERSIKNRITGGIDEIGEKYGVLFREGMDFRGAPVESASDKGRQKDRRGDQEFPPARKGLRDLRGCCRTRLCRLVYGGS